MEIVASGMLELSGNLASSQGLRAGDGATPLQGIVLNQEAAQSLGLSLWELHATALGGKVCRRVLYLPSAARLRDA